MMRPAPEAKRRKDARLGSPARAAPKLNPVTDERTKRALEALGIKVDKESRHDV